MTARSSVIIRKMDLFNSLPEDRSRSDHLQREIADQLASEKEPIDELQLAALLGKTLLEKNGELELKLRKLQDFAEETLSTNQTLVRQLAESKDSLHFSNHLCEQLEVKVEEVETSNKYLTKLCEEKQSLLKQKSSHLESTEEVVAHLRAECEGMKRELGKMRKEATAVTRDENNVTNGPRGCESVDGGRGMEEESSCDVAELRDSISELSLKLQNSAFQKKRLERELEAMLRENSTLSRNLERTEAELVELQLKFEELSESQTQEAVVSPSPTIPLSPASFTTPRSRKNNLPLLSTPNGHCDCTEVSKSSSSCVASANTNGESLFSELDTQYSSLQQSYGELLHKCTCSASLEHKTERAAVHVGGAGGDGGGARGSGAFKELFDEMFATLRQTAKVADRLIENRA